MNSFEKSLFLITARGGSKGIPGKNIKPLGGKPLLYYSIDIARKLVNDDQICLSTDSDEIISSAQSYGLNVPFKRPSEFAQDKSGSYEVIIHALNFYKTKGKTFDRIVLLQPTSPFRTSKHIIEANNLFTSKIDMVTSVKETEANPYYNLMEENVEGFLELSKAGDYNRRQDAPKIFQYNGAVYIINTESLNKNKLHEFKKVKKYLMDDFSSVDIDSPMDWLWAEFLLEKKLIQFSE